MVKNKVIGLDIGCSSVKLAEFFRRDGKLSLSNLKIVEIDLRNPHLDMVKEAFRDINAQDARVNVVIDCARSHTRILTIPYMPRAEIRQALKWEMKKFISFPIEQAALDYEIVREISGNGVKKLKVVCACSPQETVNEYLNLLSRSGIQPVLFTQPGFALKNIITNFFPGEDKTFAVLDIGCNLCGLFIFKGRELVFSRKLPVAGRNFTQDMTRTLMSDLGKTKLSPEEAEYIKIKHGIPEVCSSDILEDKLTCAQLLSLLRPNLEKLALQIDRSFDFYREKEHGEGPERLILLGGGGNLKNLAQNLSGHLAIPVELGNPLKGIVPEDPDLLKSKADSAYRFAQAVGAALSPRGAVNLLPVEIKDQTRIMVKRSSAKALVTAVLVMLILIYTGMKMRLGVYDKRIAAGKMELNALTLQAGDVRKKLFLAKALKERVYWSDALKEIGTRIPAQVRLSELSVREKDCVLKGEIRSAGLVSERFLTEFMNSLGEGIFKKVSLITTKKSSSADKLYTFELRLGIK
jgi:type IV pilus assembly protein PilM